VIDCPRHPSTSPTETLILALSPKACRAPLPCRPPLDEYIVCLSSCLIHPFCHSFALLYCAASITDHHFLSPNLNANHPDCGRLCNSAVYPRYNSRLECKTPVLTDTKILVKHVFESNDRHIFRGGARTTSSCKTSRTSGQTRTTGTTPS
jgi:hypothetical protein